MVWNHRVCWKVCISLLRFVGLRRQVCIHTYIHTYIHTHIHTYSKLCAFQSVFETRELLPKTEMLTTTECGTDEHGNYYEHEVEIDRPLLKKNFHDQNMTLSDT